MAGIYGVIGICSLNWSLCYFVTAVSQLFLSVGVMCVSFHMKRSQNWLCPLICGCHFETDSLFTFTGKMKDSHFLVLKHSWFALLVFFKSIFHKWVF